MIVVPNRCPTCGQLARGILETLPGLALIAFDEATEEAEYQGTTEIWWDDQERVQDAQGEITLICGQHHEWQALWNE
jgi:hypothetical protein